MDNHLPLLDNLLAAIQLACKPQNAHRIVEGRQQVLTMPRAWVLQSLETVAIECLDLTDYWQYRRLLELAVNLDPNLVQRLVQMGVSSIDEDIREAARVHLRCVYESCDGELPSLLNSEAAKRLATAES